MMSGMLLHARVSASGLVHRGWASSWRRCLAERPRMSRKFGPWDIDQAEIFTETELSFAFVNLKPVVPGLLRLCHDTPCMVDSQLKC